MDYLTHVTLLALLDTLLILFLIPWVLLTKKDSTAAMLWCLLIIFMPLVGALLFWVFGFNHVQRPLRRKRLHRQSFKRHHVVEPAELVPGQGNEGGSSWQDLGALAVRVKAFPISSGNAVTLFHETQQAFDNLLAALASARHHVHLEFFIIRPDDTGLHLLEVLTRKAKEGVEVRLLYDSMGTRRLKGRYLRPLLQAGGKASAFLPLNPLRSRMQINLRNHRKIAVIDGRSAFTGGLNIGDEYLGKKASFGYWRDAFLRLEGPAVTGLQHVFVQDWDFAYNEILEGSDYFLDLPSAGNDRVQIVESGPDQETNSIREIYFAAILSARSRLWIASPYFVPDSGLLDALRLARFRNVDVRLLCLLRPDHYISFYAGRYYWSDMLAAGVKIYQYAKGMMHSKLMMVDGQWAMLGSANFDNRSLHLNFEIGCILHTTERVAELEQQFRADLDASIELEAATFAHRPLASRLVENACRLMSPIL